MPGLGGVHKPRGDPATGPPANLFGATLPSAGRLEVTLTATREVTLSPVAGRTGGHPVKGRTATSLGVTLPSGGRRWHAAAAAASVRLAPSGPVTSLPSYRKRGEKNAGPRRRRPKRPRVTLSLPSGRPFRQRPGPSRDRLYAGGPSALSYGLTIAVGPTWPPDTKLSVGRYGAHWTATRGGRVSSNTPPLLVPPVTVRHAGQTPQTGAPVSAT